MSDNGTSVDFKLSPVLSKGFGKFAKIVAVDTEMSISEKGLYAVFVSMASRDGKCFVPRRDDFLHILGINKNKYYKLFNAIRSDDFDDTGKNVIRKVRRLITAELCGAGVVHGWQFNTFTLEYLPDRYMNADRNEGSAAWQKSVALVQDINSVYAAGYGVCPRLVMEDCEISLEARGLYAYLCTFDANHSMAHPDNDTICYHLGINRKTLLKYLQELESHGYISRVRSARNRPYRYVLNEDPSNPLTSGIIVPDCEKGINPAEFSPKSKNEDIPIDDTEIPKSIFEDTSIVPVSNAKSVNEDSLMSYSPSISEFEDTPMNTHEVLKSNNRDISVRDASERDTADADIIIKNKFKKKNLNTDFNQSVIPAAVSGNLLSQEEQNEIDRWIDFKSAREIIREELFDEEDLPYDTLRQPQKLNATVKVLLDWEHRSKRAFYRNENQNMSIEIYKILVNDLTEMLTYGTYTEIAGAKIPYAKVYEQLCSNYLEIDADADYIGLGDFISDVGIAMTAANRQSKEPIKNIPKYLKGIIWSVLLDGGAKWSMQALHDM